MPHSLIVLGAGYGFETLREADGLAHYCIRYWGDRPRLAATTGSPVGTVGSQVAALFSARFPRFLTAEDTRLAALIPPSRRDRHHHYGVLAPTAPLRVPVIALAGVPDGTPAAEATESIAATAAPSRTSQGTEKAIHHRIARTTWALLLSRIHEVFPLVCPRCGGEMRIIAFITHACAVRDILSHLGEATSPPRLMPARAPPLWEMPGATLGEDEPQAVSGAGFG